MTSIDVIRVAAAIVIILEGGKALAHSILSQGIPTAVVETKTMDHHHQPFRLEAFFWLSEAVVCHSAREACKGTRRLGQMLGCGPQRPIGMLLPQESSEKRHYSAKHC
jgi:hypothetical protein